MDMVEHQASEYKQIWKDEYLKWVCGFANAQGGKIYIGKNDQGEVTGLAWGFFLPMMTFVIRMKSMATCSRRWNRLWKF